VGTETPAFLATSFKVVIVSSSREF